VDHSVEGLAMVFGGYEKAFKRGPVSQLSFDKIHPCRKQIASPVAQVVKNNCLVSLFDQKFSNGTTDVPRASGNKDFHNERNFL
jgi:hypothetical protein